MPRTRRARRSEAVSESGSDGGGASPAKEAAAEPANSFASGLGDPAFLEANGHMTVQEYLQQQLEAHERALVEHAETRIGEFKQAALRARQELLDGCM